MIQKPIQILMLAALITSCSKKEEPAPPTPPSAPAKTDAPSPTVQSVGSNAQNAVAATTSSANDLVTRTAISATNAVQSAVAATNALSQKSAEAANLSPQPSAPAPVSSPDNATATPSPAASSSIAALSSDQVSQALKEALGKGLQHAVSTLGQPGGFLTNLNVKIPIPEKLQLIEKGLRAINQGQYADQCITTMNQAAEQAVPAAADVFVNSLKNMSVQDAKSLLSGPQDAATQYFRKATEAELTTKFSPIVQQAMTKCGTTAAYQQLLDKAKGASPFFSNPSLDLNAYVTGKAMDGLFKTVAEEEKRIRENPVARSSELLKSVFGSLTK
jgi:Protein of unknown function (DUF4197)